MSKRKQPSVSEALRAALAAVPSLNEVRKACDLEHASLRRFRDGKTSLRLDCAERLLDYFGFQLSQPRKSPRPASARKVRSAE